MIYLGEIMTTIHESGENYLETILELEIEKKPIRSAEIAKRLNVSRPSVNKAINILREAGMVEQERYGTIALTDDGRKRASKVKSRHELLFDFLANVLDINKDTATNDACRIEHIVSEQTIDSLTSFIKSYKK
ncbi:MAG: metal-dependent transcriptional regulator [Clostridia bacterium]